MSLERILSLVANFRDQVGRARAGRSELIPIHEAGLAAGLAEQLLESMLLARHLDVAAHQLRAQGSGHYTICSAGHERNVVFGQLTGVQDLALLHYRSAALQVERSRPVPSVDAVADIVLSLVAARDEPMSGERHKVFGQIQYLAYLHNAEDQLRGEAATLSFFSNARLSNPCLVRVAGLAYQKGFGGQRRQNSPRNPSDHRSAIVSSGIRPPSVKSFRFVFRKSKPNAPEKLKNKLATRAPGRPSRVASRRAPSK